MGIRAKDIIDTIALICIPAMILFFSLLLSYLIFLRVDIENIYGKVIGIYGVPIIFSLCFLPMKLTASCFKEVGICRNRKIYQDIIAIVGMMVIVILFFYENNINKMESAYILQFIFVGLGEEVFFRAILYQQFKHLCKSENIAILIVAAIFAYLFHSDGGIVVLLIVRMPLSIIFSLIYIKTDSLSIPIILHSLYDILI